MDEAAPQSAAVLSDTWALEVLHERWGPEGYLTGHDEEHGWWAALTRATGHIITTASPDALWNAIEDEDRGISR